MKRKAFRKYFILFAFLQVAIFLGHSATITWTNTAGGNWSAAANWYPNQVPGLNDTAMIPLAATNGAALDIAATVQNLVLDGGNLINTGYSYDTLTVNGQINWTNGILGCIVTNNGVLTLAGTNGVDYQLTQFLYNNGTINLVSGNLLINYCGYNFGAFFNASNAVLNLQHDAEIDISQNQFGLCPPPFNNAGIIRKSGGTSTSHIYPPLNNSGTVDVQTGTISFNGGGDLNGTLQSEGTGALVFGTNIYNGQPALTLDGNLISTNAFLEGADLQGSGAINGVLTWNFGALVQGAGSLTVGAHGVLILAGTNGFDYVLSGEIYNAGTFKLVSGNLLVNYCGSGNGELVNQPGGLIDIENDVSIDASCGGQLINLGTVRKSGGTGTSDIGTYFSNGSGTLDAETGTIGLTNSYYLTGGTLNFGINSLTSYGQITLAGNPTLSGTLSVNLNGGYVPADGNTFSLLTYNAASGFFNPLALPSWINWQTNYGPTALTLTVLNLNGPPKLAGAAIAPGQFSFQFAGNPSANYSVLATTNLLMPLTDWTVLGSATLISNDLFEYLDTHITNSSQRFYKLRSP